MKYHLTEDRVFGRMYYGEIEDFMEPNKLQRARKRLQEHAGFRIVYGFAVHIVIDFVKQPAFMFIRDPPLNEVSSFIFFEYILLVIFRFVILHSFAVSQLNFGK